MNIEETKALESAQNECRRVITEPLYPPIPTRSFDWIAYFDGGEAGPRGYGGTPEAAESDLMDNATYAP